MRKVIVSVFFGSLVLMATAQQDPQFSQNMNNRLFPNPGVAGSNDAVCANILGRNQWVGFEGRPETYLFSAHMPFTLPFINKGSGVGLSVMTDRLGQESTFALKLAYAYRQQLNLGGVQGKLGIGIGLGMVSKSLGRNWRATDPFFSDSAIPDAGAGDSSFDMDFGLYYKTERLYFGISTTHLSESDLQDAGEGLGGGFSNNPDVVDVNFNYRVVRHYYVMAGYDYPLQNNPLFVLQPSLFVKSEALSTQVDVNLNVLYNNMFWGGVSYRLADAIIPMAGLNYQFQGVPGTFRFGYSYDVTTSLIRQASSGSHEVFIGYCFKIKSNPPLQKYKTVRFL